MCLVTFNVCTIKQSRRVDHISEHSLQANNSSYFYHVALRIGTGLTTHLHIHDPNKSRVNIEIYVAEKLGAACPLRWD